MTRKIFIRDIERIGTSVFEQIRGSPMGSPLSPALCMMVVALSEEIWYRTYRTTLTTMDLSARLLRYVDNRLCLADPSWDYEICFANSFTRVLRPSNHFGNGTGPGVPGLLHRVRAFRTSLQPSARLQPGHGPLLRITSSGTTIWFRLTTLFVAKCAHPAQEQPRGFCRIAPFVQSSRFCESDLTAAAKPIRQYLHTSSLW